MRARYPDIEETLERDGVTIGYEVHGTGGPTILMPSSMPLVHGRQWKAQVPFLARHFRVVVVDTPGQRPQRPAARRGGVHDGQERRRPRGRPGRHRHRARPSPSGSPGGGRHGPGTGRGAPGPGARGRCAIAPTMVFDVPGFEEVRDSHEGLEKINRHYITKEFDDFAAIFLAACSSDPHSTKQWED